MGRKPEEIPRGVIRVPIPIKIQIETGMKEEGKKTTSEYLEGKVLIIKDKEDI